MFPCAPYGKLNQQACSNRCISYISGLMSLFKDLLELVEDGGERERVAALAKEFSITIK